MIRRITANKTTNMDTTETFSTYLNEFNSPSVNWDENTNTITPMELNRYSASLDKMRIEFIEAILHLSPSMQEVYLKELEDRQEKINKFGYASIPTNNILALIQNGIVSESMLSCHLLHTEQLKNIGKAIATIKGIKSEKGINEIKEPQPKDETSTVEKEPNLPKVISGTDGLKDYLGCSHNKAFDIIKSRILPKDVQYKTGNVWKFNRAKLDKFISENPEILGKVRAKGRLDE